MTQLREDRKERKPRQTIRRSAEFKAALSAASSVLATKMAETRSAWDTK